MSYAGQHGERMRLLGELEKAHPELLFTERDRRLANTAIKAQSMPSTVYNRLRDQRDYLHSIQAENLLDAFMEACGTRDQATLEQSYHIVGTQPVEGIDNQSD